MQKILNKLIIILIDISVNIYIFTSPEDTMKNYNRREFLHDVALPAAAGSLLLSTGALTGCSSFIADPELPNIIFITADDLGWKDLPAYGNKDIKTPALDRLAREGIHFENAFVVASSCAPSRASFITGQYPHTNGVTALTHRYKTKSLSPFHTTMPGLLKKSGYNTALQGKWHVSPYLPVSLYGYQERLSTMLPKGWPITDGKKALQYIRSNKNNRFYLEMNFLQNHRDDNGEFSMAKDFPVDYKKIKVPRYWTLPDSVELRKDIAKYYSQTMAMDKIIGEVLDELDRLKLTENTMVVFVSDNGPPYPGNKMSLYDRGTGTPLIVRWPKKLPSKKTIPHLVNTIDIAPTMLEAAGLTVPPEMEGISLLPMMKAKKPRPVRDALFMEMTHHVRYVPMRAVRTIRYKYIKNYSDNPLGLDQNSHDAWARDLCRKKNQPWLRPRIEEELYDLAADPHEQKNLSSDPAFENELKKMRALLKEHMKKTKDPYLNKPFSRDYNPEEYLPEKEKKKDE